MFTKIRLCNFRSFADVTLDLTLKKNSYKSFAVIYGENGIGKSNLTCGISALIDLMRTMDVRDMLDSMLSSEQFQKFVEVFGNSQELTSGLPLKLRDITTLVQEYRMTGSEEPILLEYEFLIKQKKGRYLIELDEQGILHERLEYVLEKNRGVYFDLTPENQKINARIFKNNEIFKDIRNLVNRFWGKHSLLAILMHEKNDKSKKYIDEGLSNLFHELMTQFCDVSCYLRASSEERGVINNRLHLLAELEEGVIRKTDEKKLDITAHALSHFFNSINSDNRYLYYQKNLLEGNRIKYKLFIRKFIAGQERDIEFTHESSGNHQLLRIFPYLLVAMAGGTVIIDEIDTGIHDVLMQKILSEAVPFIYGQLIVTTHNTSLMEMDNIRTSIYIITEDDAANTRVRCIDDYEERTFEKNNIRSRYLEKKYRGIPEVSKIGFDTLFQTLTANP